MKQISKLTAALLLIVIVAFSTGCASSKKSHCGCEGMIGYK